MSSAQHIAKHPLCNATVAWERVDVLTKWALEGSDAVAQRVLPWWIQHALEGGCDGTSADR